MFSVKPPTARQEFAELHELFGTAGLADVLGRRPESVSRLKARERYTRPLERLIDDVWSVVHAATTGAQWAPDQVRAFLLLRQPQLGLKPAAELIRAGRTEAVLDAIRSPRSSRASNEVEARARRVVTSETDQTPSSVVKQRRSPKDPVTRAAAQRRLAERGLRGLDRERLLAAGHEAWGGASQER